MKKFTGRRSKGWKFHFTQDEEQYIRDTIDEDAALVGIELGRSRKAILQARRRLGLSTRRAPYKYRPPGFDEILAERYVTGVNVRALAAELGCSEKVLRKRANELGLRLNRRGPTKIVNPLTKEEMEAVERAKVRVTMRVAFAGPIVLDNLSRMMRNHLCLRWGYTWEEDAPRTLLYRDGMERCRREDYYEEHYGFTFAARH